MRKFFGLPLVVVLCSVAFAQNAPQSPFIKVKEPVVAIQHVTVIDGTGSNAKADQTVILRDGKIDSVGATASASVPTGAKVIDGSGHTLIPGLVGMHEHLFLTAPALGDFVMREQPFSAPQLYLASGITTARTTGSIEPYTDLQIKRAIEAGSLVGPKLDLTTPYLDGKPSLILQLHEMNGPEEATEMVRYWYSIGFTSVKAYMSITPEELKAAIAEAHRDGIKITGHLCSVSFREAVALGIDNLEHGPYIAPDSEFDPSRKPGDCLSQFGEIDKGLSGSDPTGAVAMDVIHDMVSHHVALTSTLAVAEEGLEPPFSYEYRGWTYKIMSPEQWSYAMTNRAHEEKGNEHSQMLLTKEMQFERAFVKAGGLMMAGCDPTGDGHTLAGLGDQRQMELMVKAGFSVPEAVEIYTLNGAKYLGRDASIGTIVPGKIADLVLLKGDLAKDVNVIEKPEIVFKDGVGYDSQAIYESLRGLAGVR